MLSPEAAFASLVVVFWLSKRSKMPCNGGMISKVCGEGKGTVCGDAVASFEGLSGATEDLGRGVAAVGDLEVILEIQSRSEFEGWQGP